MPRISLGLGLAGLLYSAAASADAPLVPAEVRAPPTGSRIDEDPGGRRPPQVPRDVQDEPTVTPTHSSANDATPPAPAVGASPRQESSIAQPDHAPTQKRNGGWYGYQTLALDGIAAVAIIAGGASESAGLAVPGLAVYAFGAPVVHEVHHRGGAAAGSLGLRVGLPLLAGAIGSAVETCTPGEWFCGLDGFAEGFLGGMAGAVVLDAAFLAHESEPDDAEDRASSVSWSVAPAFDPKHGAASVGLVGAF